MLDVALGTILLFFCLTLIGLGPALLLQNSSKKHTFLASIMSPVVGLALTTLVGSYLVLMDLPVERWASGWLVVGIFCSLILFVFQIRHQTNFLQQYFNRTAFVFFSGFILTALLLLMPILVSDFWFTILRGNGHDQFNYMEMAQYLMIEPFSWFKEVDQKTLINKNPIYFQAVEHFDQRWQTAMLLAWSSCITHIPIYKIEYGFKILFFMTMYCTAFGFAKILQFRLWQIISFSLIVTIGFWPQLITDIQAFSNISALPLLVFIVFLIQKIDLDKEKNNIGYLFLGLALTSITLLYVEIMPIILAAIFLYFIIKFYQEKTNFLPSFKMYLISFLVFGVLISFFAEFLIDFFVKQFSFAINYKNTWWTAYFEWLYRWPISGLWDGGNLSTNIAMPKLLVKIYNIYNTLIGLVLCVLLLFSLLIPFIKRSDGKIFPVNIFNCLGFISLCGFLFLLVKSQLWAAAKVFSYSYPFYYASIFYAGNYLKVFVFNKYKIIDISIISIVVINIFMGLYRPWIAYSGVEYKCYITHHGMYKTFDVDFSKFLEFFHTHNVKTLGLVVSPSQIDQWNSEYITLVLTGNKINVYLLNGIYMRDNFIRKQDIPESLQYILVRKSLLKDQTIDILLQNNDYVLINSKNYKEFLTLNQ